MATRKLAAVAGKAGRLKSATGTQKASSKKKRSGTKRSGRRGVVIRKGTILDEFELSICNIRLSPAAPVHDQPVTVSVTVSPAAAQVDMTIYKNNVEQTAKVNAGRVVMFTVAEMGTPNAGDDGRVKVKATMAGFPSEGALSHRTWVYL